MRSPTRLRRRRLRRGVNPAIICIVVLALAGAFALWRGRQHYFALYEDTEVPRRQLALLAQRRDALNARLASHPPAGDEADPVSASVRADLAEVETRLTTVERVRGLALETYRARVSPTLIWLLRLPRAHR